MTPLLISSFGVTPQIAVGTDLLYASITKTAGAGAITSRITSNGRSCFASRRGASKRRLSCLPPSLSFHSTLRR
jgi:hypothetical protein